VHDIDDIDATVAISRVGSLGLRGDSIWTDGLGLIRPSPCLESSGLFSGRIEASRFGSSDVANVNPQVPDVAFDDGVLGGGGNGEERERVNSARKSRCFVVYVSCLGEG